MLGWARTFCELWGGKCRHRVGEALLFLKKKKQKDFCPLEFGWWVGGYGGFFLGACAGFYVGLGERRVGGSLPAWREAWVLGGGGVRVDWGAARRGVPRLGGVRRSVGKSFLVLFFQKRTALLWPSLGWTERVVGTPPGALRLPSPLRGRERGGGSFFTWRFGPELLVWGRRWGAILVLGLRVCGWLWRRFFLLFTTYSGWSGVGLAVWPFTFVSLVTLRSTVPSVWPWEVFQVTLVPGLRVGGLGMGSCGGFICGR